MDPFGNIIQSKTKEKNNYLFTGKERDIETGLDYFGARYYNSELGRFITKEPIPGLMGDTQGFNPYIYCANNPINKSDPLGLFTLEGYEFADDTTTWTGEDYKKLAEISEKADEMNIIKVTDTALVLPGDPFYDDMSWEEESRAVIEYSETISMPSRKDVNPMPPLVYYEDSDLYYQYKQQQLEKIGEAFQKFRLAWNNINWDKFFGAEAGQLALEYWIEQEELTQPIHIPKPLVNNSTSTALKSLYYASGGDFQYKLQSVGIQTLIHTGNYTGQFFSALWTPSTWRYTSAVLMGAAIGGNAFGITSMIKTVLIDPILMILKGSVGAALLKSMFEYNSQTVGNRLPLPLITSPPPITLVIKSLPLSPPMP